MNDYEHMDPSVTGWFSRPDEERAQFIVDSRPSWFIEYPAIDPIRRTVLRTMRAKPSTRGRHILLYGHSHAGKSQIIQHCVDLFRAELKPGTASTVLELECTAKFDEIRFYEHVVLTTHAPAIRSVANSQKTTQGLTILQNLSVGIVILDELHTMLLQSPLRQREFLAFLKFLSNSKRHKITFICAGTHSARNAIYADRELSTRFRELHVGPMGQDTHFQGLLGAFERLLPIRFRSDLRSPNLARVLWRMSEGIVGELASLLEDAAVAAIDDGDEKITVELLQRLDWTQPSERRGDGTVSVSDMDDPDLDAAA